MIIWVFREQRSGSTAFVEKLAHLLGRQNVMVEANNPIDNVINLENPQDYLFSTHQFDLLEQVDQLYTEPVLLIRCTRKDKVEQCLSLLIVRWANFGRQEDQLQYNLKASDHENVFESASPTIFTKAAVANYFNQVATIDTFWNTYAQNHLNLTVYYEDLCSSGVNLFPLGINNLTIADDSYTIKLPNSYKDRLCINHAMVRRWASELNN